MSPEWIHMGGAAVTVAAAWATAAVVAARSPFWNAELAEVPARHAGLDGLRGWLAFFVFLHHAALARHWWESGRWGYTESRILLRIGPAAVLVFFMITGWLFWKRARRDSGRVDPIGLLRGRLARLAPAYLLAALLILIVASGMLLSRPPGLWIGDVGRLLTLGARRWSTLAHHPDYLLNAGVNWTLWYEWRFYAALPLLSWFAVGQRVWVPVAALLMLVIPVGQGWSEYWLAFLPGVLAAHLWDVPGFRRALGHRLFPGVALAWFAVASLVPSVRGYTWTRVVALAPLFLAVLAGHRFGGLLHSAASRLLGCCSYSLYLLHGILLMASLRLLSHLQSPATMPLVVVWGVFAGVAVLTVVVSAASYRWVERPWIRRASHPGAGKQGGLAGNPG